MTESGNARGLCKHPAHAVENLFVQITFTWRGRHLDRNDGHARSAELPIEVGSVFPQKLLNDSRLPHAGCAVNDQAGHAISRGIVDQVQQSFQNAFSTRILYPALLTKPVDALVVVQQGSIPAGRLQMGKLVRLQVPSQISTGYGFISTDASFPVAG